MLGQDLGQLRQCLLGAVFLVAADQHHLAAGARALLATIDQRFAFGGGMDGRALVSSSTAKRVEAT